jgi:hypothetical protein
MTEFETLVLAKLDFIILQTAPKKKNATAPPSKDAEAVLKLFNRYFNKNLTMTALNKKCITARLRDGFTINQIEDWFIFATTDKWWSEKKHIHKVSTMLGDKLGERLDSMGIKRDDTVDKISDSMLGL